ncbi:MAG: hypothetical protein JO122_03720 [Acetobacteraceae bacterium]|nr:hypothetical protein [Acetobacteraceae bacterium]
MTQPSSGWGLFPQIPVMLTVGIGDISLNQFSAYATLDIHKGALLMNMALTE